MAISTKTFKLNGVDVPIKFKGHTEDDQVWPKAFGKTAMIGPWGGEKRPLNTADEHFKTTGPVDGHERRAWVKGFMKDPQTGLQGLLVDSANKTPVVVTLPPKLIGDVDDQFGVMDASFRVDKGQVNIKIDVDIRKKAIDEWLGKYDTSKPYADGESPKFSLGVVGKINADGGIDGFNFSAALSGLPEMDAEKILGVPALIKEINKVLYTAEKGITNKDRRERIQDAVSELREIGASAPIEAICKAIDQDEASFEGTIKTKRGNCTVDVKGGDGKLDLVFKDPLSIMSDGELAIDGSVSLTARSESKGWGKESQESFDVKKAELHPRYPMNLSWEDGEPVLHAVTPEGNKRVNEHAEDLVELITGLVAGSGIL